MLAGTLAFIAGIYTLMQLSSLPSLFCLLLLPVLIILYRNHVVFRYAFYFYFGFCYVLLVSYLQINHGLEPKIENKDVIVTGVITSVPEIRKDHSRFLIELETLSDKSRNKFKPPKLARLSWYKSKSIPKPGEKWQFKVRMKRPYSFMNSGGFDYEAWMFRQGIKATGYVKKSALNKKIKNTNQFFIEKQRYKIASQLKQQLDNPILGLVLALSLGERSQLNAGQWQVLTQTGTNHLIAISGLHLGLIAGFIYFIAYFIWRQFYFLTQRLPAPYFASLAAFVGAIIYALLSGFALPAQRAIIMLGVLFFSIIQPKRMLISNVISIAAILILILDPFAVIAVDFYLSFMAVMFILYLTRFRVNKQYKLTKWIVLQCLLSLCLVPILILWFKQIPLYSVIANLVAIPIIGFLIVPLSLIALIFLFVSPVLAETLYALIETIYAWLWSWLAFLSELNYSVIAIASPNLISLFLVLVGVLILTMPRGLPARYLGIFFFLPLLFPMKELFKDGEFEFVLLDVGQGLSAVVQTQNHTLLYDAGARFSERFNTGDAVVKPYLRQKGVRDLSMFIVSHGDNDHIGGANAVINNFRINQIISSVPEKLAGEKAEHCGEGQLWQWDDVDFEMLSLASATGLSGNNASCVLKVSSKYGSVLLTGDIEKEAEAVLVNKYRKKLISDILLVPHHGSKTSSTKAFISAVSPEYAFIPAGYKNRFGFPKQDIMARYDTFSVKTYISHETGELSAKFFKTGLQINEFRTKNRRFWHH